MTKRRILLIGIPLAGLAIVGLVLLLKPEREPEYGGKKLSEWVQKYGEENPPPGNTLTPFMSYPSPALTGEVSFAIRQIGTNAIPHLLKWIRDSDCYRRDRRSIRAKGAIGAFSSLGPEAAGAIGELSKILSQTNDTCTSGRAADALAFIGREALPVLMGVLTNQQAGVLPRCSVIRSMASMATNARPALPALIECLKSKDDVLVLYAASTLGSLKLDAAAVVPALAASLEHTNPRVRCVATAELRAFGRQASPALPPLLKRLSDPDLSVRELATNALRHIDPAALKRATH